MHSKIMIRRMKAAAEKQANHQPQLKPSEFQLKQRQYFLEMAQALSEKQQQHNGHHQEVIVPVVKISNNNNDVMGSSLIQLRQNLHLVHQQNTQSHHQQQFNASGGSGTNLTSSTTSTDDEPTTSNNNNKVHPALPSSSSHYLDSSSSCSTSNSDKWDRNFQDLLNFRKVYGNCLVPYQWDENKRLAHWVKRQRYHYKLKKHGTPGSTLTHERQDALDQIGFVWEPHDARWEERLNDLKNYKKVLGTCNVPGTCTYSPRLADWVKSQRRNYRNFIKGKPSKLTQARIAKMDALGFVWNPKDLNLTD